MFDIGRVKIDDIVDTLLWDALKKGLDGVTVRIDKGKTAATRRRKTIGTARAVSQLPFLPLLGN